MKNAAVWREQCIDEKGVVSFARAEFRQGSRLATIYTDPGLKIPATNPLTADIRGQFVCYVQAGDAYEVTVTRPSGTQFERWLVTGVPLADLPRTVLGVESAPITEEATPVSYIPAPDEVYDVAEPAPAPPSEPDPRDDRIARLEAELAEIRAEAEEQARELEAAQAALAERDAVPAEGKASYSLDQIRVFVEAQRAVGEPYPDAQKRLENELEVLMNKTRLVPPAPLSEAERERYRELTKGLGR